MNNVMLFNVTSLFLFFISYINCYNQSYLEHFNTRSLSGNFQTFNLSSCSESVSQCWRDVHEMAERCIRHHRSKSGSKIAQCTAREDLQMSEKQYEELSFQWHHSMDKCFHGHDFHSVNDSSDEEGEEVEISRTSKLFRRKRAQNLVEDNAAENLGDDDDDEQEDNDENNLKKAKLCWSKLRRRKSVCFELSLQCPQFSSCFGMGKRPDEGNTRNWYKLVKQQRKAAQQKTQDHKQKMLKCIESE